MVISRAFLIIDKASCSVRRPIGLRPHHDESSYIKTREMAFCCQFAVYYAFVLCMQKESKDRSFRCGTKHAGVDSSRAY